MYKYGESCLGVSCHHGRLPGYSFSSVKSLSLVAIVTLMSMRFGEWGQS